jgi:putative transposase
MPRPPRQWVPGGIYHVFSRGSNRQAIFRYDSDRADLLDCAARVIERYELECLAFALMTNHCHFLLKTENGGISSAMRDLNGRYARRFNLRYEREAHAFRNRFGAVLQESDEQLRWTVRYIVTNPVKAGLCAHPSEWPWTSHRATLGIADPPGCLSLVALLLYFGDTPENAVAAYIDFIEASEAPDSV